jgi:hypothetical protein
LEDVGIGPFLMSGNTRGHSVVPRQNYIVNCTRVETSNRVELLVPQRSMLKLVLAVKLVQQRVTGAALRDSCTPHTPPCCRCVHWIATVSATVFETLASSCRLKKNLYFLRNSSFSVVTLQFNRRYCIRTAAGAFSEPAVQ